MYAIFAMLFGLSFFIQHDNQAQKGVDFRPRFLWRMILLMGAAFIGLQYLFCTWWLKSHKRGPFEQLWHKATWLGK